MRFRKHAALTVLVACVIGCGSGEPAVARVTGRVSYMGKPLTTGRVLFLGPSNHGVGSDIDAAGNFALQGAIGSNVVTVESREPGKRVAMGPEQTEKMVPGKSIIPDRYQAPSLSGLTCVVKPGGNVYDIDLQD